MATPAPTVLFVDNGQGRASTYSTLLQQDTTFKYQLIEERYGAHLPRLCQSLQIDGILLEHCPASLDGLDLLSRFQLQLGETCPPIIMIGSEDIKAAVAALKAGAADYLVREQLTPDSLCLALHTAFENATLKRKLQSSQEKFQASIETMLDCFGIFSAVRNETGQIIDFRIDYLNAAACENNCLPWEVQMGKGLCEVLPGHRASGLFDDYCRLVETGDPLIKEDLIYEDLYDGQRLERAYDIRASKLKDGFVASWRDVTASKQLELELSQKTVHLEQQRQQFQQLIDTAPIGIGVGCTNGEVRVINDTMLALCGYTRAEVEQHGLNWHSLVPPEHLPKTEQALAQLRQSGIVLPEEKELVRRDGSRIPLMTCAMQWGADPEAHVTFALDLSQQKQVEAELRASQQHYQELAERLRLATQAVRGLVYDWNIETDEVYRSEQLFELIGIHPEEAPPTLRWWCDLIHPDDLSRLYPLLQKVCEGTDEFYESEYRVRHRDGHWVEVWERSYLVRNQQGKVVRIVGSTIDITDEQSALKERQATELALRQSQEQLALAMQAAQMHSWEVDLKTGRIDWSTNLQHMLGLTPGSFDGRYETVMAMIHPEDRDRVQESMRQAIEDQEDYHAEFRFIKPDGSIRWTLGAGKVFYDTANTPIKMIGVDIDITTQKQAELDLRNTHIQLESALVAGAVYTWRWDIQADRVITNRSFARSFGVDASGAVVGFPIEHFLEAIHPEDRPQVAAAIDRAIDTHDYFSTEFRIHNASEEERWCIARGQVEYGPGGNPLALIGALADITNRKQAEIRSAHNESRLQAFADANVIGILQGDIYGNIHWANDEFLRLIGYTQAEFQAKHLRWDDITPPDYQAVDQEKIAEARLSGACTPYEKAYLHKNGRRVPVLIGYSLVGATQEETVVFVLDLTDRKRTEKQLRRSEDRLRMALKSTQMGTWDWKIKTDQLIWDDTCKALFGLAPQDSASLDVFFTAMHPEDRPDIETAIQIALNSNPDGNFDVEFRILNPHDCSEHWIASQGQVYFRSNGDPDRFIGTVRDITEQKQAEANREELLLREHAAREAAERANRIKDEFLAILSHELRSPLNPILGWAKLLQNTTMDSEKTARALSTIERNAKLQAQLIDDLLDIARILRGKLKLETSPLNLAFVIESAVETVQSAASEKSISIQMDLAEVGQVHGDAARLQQIVWNLLTNAVKFTPNQGQVNVQLTQMDDQAQIIVSDTGIGIHPDFLPYIFESFRQEDTSITRQFGGLGLGLSIVRYLVEAHGGTITADSPGEGQGATFTVSLPLINHVTKAASATPLTVNDIDLTDVTVMVVEDNPDSLELIQVSLAQYGAHVVAFTEAEAALAAFENFQPDVLISDIGMPDMDGYALIRQIRNFSSRQSREIPAIALTAYVREEDVKKALNNGFQVHIAKPVNPTKIALTVAELAMQSSSQ
jgi:PAS domain S-box-containing protein